MRDRRTLLLIPVTVLVGLQAASAMHLFGWGDPAPPAVAGVPIGGPFTLTAPDGRPVTDRDFRGKVMLIYFGYTNCPDSCPTALNDIANALDLLGPKTADVAPLFITIDPARDTPAVMGAYVRKFDSRILGLSGTPAQIEQVKHAYRIYAAPEPQSLPGHMIMDHSSVFFVMDRQGRFADVLNANSTPQVVAAKLGTLVR